MASENTATNAQAAPIDWKFPFAVSSEWFKPFTQGPGQFYAAACREALGFAASRLQEQADYVKKLSECTDPAEALKYHTEFMQDAMKRSYSDGSKLLETLRGKLSAAGK